MTSLRSAAPISVASLQPPIFVTVLLLRRWRADKSFMRMALVRLGLHQGLPAEVSEGNIKGRTVTQSLRALLLGSLLVSAMLSIPVGAGISLLSPAMPLTFVLIVGAALSLSSGFLTGASVWRRVGIFPFDSLRRLAPTTDQRIAGILTRTELLYCFCTRSLPWMVAGVFTVATTVRHLDAAFGSIVAIVVLPSHALLFVLGFTAGARASTMIVATRASRFVGAGRLALTMLFSGVAAIFGWVFVHVTFVVMLGAVRDSFPTWAAFLEDANWDRFLAEVTDRLDGDLGDAVFLVATVDWSQILLVTVVFGVGVCALLALSPARLVPTGVEQWRTAGRPDAVDVAVRCVRRFSAGRGTYAEAMVRRLEAHRWLLAQHFWGRVLPTIEGWVYLGVATAIAQGVSDSFLVTLVLVMGAVFVGHNHATELRVELAPVTALGAERRVLPVLMQAPGGRGVQIAIQSRWRMIRVLMIPAMVTASAVLSAVGIAAGVPSLNIALIVLATIAVMVCAPIVQWYMGALLLAEAANERAVEHGLGSASDVVQDRLQGLPRYALVVAPAFVTLLAVIFEPAVPSWACTALVAVVIILHFAAVAGLRHLAVRWTGRLQDHGLAAWRVR